MLMFIKYRDLRGRLRIFKKGRDYACLICAHKQQISLVGNSFWVLCRKPSKRRKIFRDEKINIWVRPKLECGEFFLTTKN